MKLIYCVEDDPGIRELIACTLNTADFEVVGFEEPQTFLAELKKKKPDLVLLDIMLPKTDGIIILKKLKQDDLYCDIPVIMLTAKSMEIDKVNGLESGADELIITGNTIIATVSTPDKIDVLKPSIVTKNIIPNNPYIMEGIPAKVSTAKRITFTALFPLLAYSVRYMAQNTPTGTANKRDKTIITKVATIEENADKLSES